MIKYINKALLVTAIAAIGVTTTHAAGNGSSPKGKPFVAINGELIEVRGEISSLQDQIDSLVGRVDTIEAMVVANTDAIAVLNDRNAALELLINQNITDTQQLYTLVSDLEIENTALLAQIEANGDAVGDLQAQIDSNTAEINNLAQAILLVETSVVTLGDSLQAQIDNNSDLIQALQIQVDQLNDELSEKQNRINGLCPDGSAIQQILADGSVLCEAVTGGTGSLQVYFAYNFADGTGFHQVYATCPSDYVAAGCGYHGHNASIEDVRVIGGNRCYVFGYSQVHLYAEGTCLKIAP